MFLFIVLLKVNWRNPDTYFILIVMVLRIQKTLTTVSGQDPPKKILHRTIAH